MKILIVALVLIAVSLILKFTQLILKRIIDNYSIKKNMHAVEPILIIVVWISVVFWIVYFLFYEKPYYNFIVIALIALIIILIGWFFVKDFAAGIVFKINNNYSSGETVQFGEITGILDALLLTHISIYTKEGKLIKIPYSRLNNEIISHKSSIGSFSQNIYLLKVPRISDAEETKESIQKFLLNTPWRISNAMPVVQMKSENKNEYEFEIRLETRNETHFNYVIAFLKRKFEQ